MPIYKAFDELKQPKDFAYAVRHWARKEGWDEERATAKVRSMTVVVPDDEEEEQAWWNEMTRPTPEDYPVEVDHGRCLCRVNGGWIPGFYPAICQPKQCSFKPVAGSNLCAKHAQKLYNHEHVKQDVDWYGLIIEAVSPWCRVIGSDYMTSGNFGKGVEWNPDKHAWRYLPKRK
jgi:hypothetical protein